MYSVCPYVDIQFAFQRYSIDEGHSPLWLQLVLSISLSTDITVQVESNDIIVTGKILNFTLDQLDYISGPTGLHF